METSKKKRTSIIVTVIIIVILVVLLAAYGVFCLWIKDSKDLTQDITEYEEYLGANGKYKETFSIYNDIFPDSIPVSAEVEDFYFLYFNPWDANYMGYLVYTCDDKKFDEEYGRLKNISSSQNKYVYGATEFPYELCAVYADSYYGYIYALADREENRFIYVEILFCNYFTDIDYEVVIPEKYLPSGFDATLGNSIRQKFESQI